MPRFEEKRRLNNAQQYKVLVVGEKSSGKSSLVLRAADDQYAENISTLGVDYKKVNYEVDNSLYELQIFDNIHNPNHYRGPHAIVICVDLTDPSSIQKAKQQMRTIQERAVENVPVIFAGTKSDLNNKVVISKEEMEGLANEYKEHSATYVETSAKTGRNVETVFDTAINQINRKRALKNAPSAENNVLIENEIEPEPGCKLAIPQPWRPKAEGISVSRGTFNSTGLALGVGSLVAGVVGLVTLNPALGAVAGVIAGAVTFLATAAIQLLINNKVNRGGFFKMPESPIKLPNVSFQCPIKFNN